VLDIRGVDIVTARLVSQVDLPVFVISFRTQEIHVYRDVKTGEIKAGVEDRIQQVPRPPKKIVQCNAQFPQPCLQGTNSR
jgi:hypothetical protein